ncbi:ArsR/SmtB family transcription factor [Demequina muriae]|uniref:Metalloregulator ArsR/SmtB family transcription factor n=1 Tax=Demequina muriae TaxID=3051664 RepID=A0ABT8GDE4_9MICO|nr:metalloregulator ArsR/SmtB family transcription factor [Demequina sp. EGI L300058]MDN4479453.1 metalloregulator ArsR/SmtB family transcription factor [Demequina sp. EGI L300058]
MAVPLHQAKAELFRTLGHPVRIRVLELLLEEPKQVRELLGEIEVEASNLSQQLAVLRRSGIVSSYREGATVMYRLSTPDVAELMGSARRILASMLTSQEDLLAELRTEMPTETPVAIPDAMPGGTPGGEPAETPGGTLAATAGQTPTEPNRT